MSQGNDHHFKTPSHILTNGNPHYTGPLLFKVTIRSTLELSMSVYSCRLDEAYGK